MNSEQLELSLRAEFESYLKGVLAKVQQDVSDFQRNFEAEFEKHKTQLDEAIRNLSTRFESDPDFDRAFTESITEHLRLARDEGATITAEAIGEAEKLKTDSAPAVSYDRLRDAIKDISSQTTQSAILKSLVDNAGEFAPRGAFFIVRNDHFVGWRVFGKEGNVDEASVQAVHFPVSADSVLSSATSSLSMQEGSFGSHSDDNAFFLEPLGFGRPDRMVAIPLIARGRGVAVMYADYGITGVSINSDALETLVRVAGLTVELLAAANEVKAQQEMAASAPAVPAAPEFTHSVATQEAAVAPEQQEPSPAVREQEPAVEEPRPSEPAEEYTGAVSFDTGKHDVEAGGEADFGAAEHVTFVEEFPETESDVTYFEPEAGSETGFEAEETTRDFEPAPRTSFDDREESWKTTETSNEGWGTPVAAEPSPAVEEYALSGNGNGHSAVTVAEPVVEVTQPVRGRFSDRNVDLPIDVPDDERKSHNNARRFARLLVSEIKLYNEQKVIEGREANDLYDRLRDAIDRSREMYEKRVEPEVASKFDYFHYELVNGLAEGKDERLGQSYSKVAS